MNLSWKKREKRGRGNNEWLGYKTINKESINTNEKTRKEEMEEKRCNNDTTLHKHNLRKLKVIKVYVLWFYIWTLVILYETYTNMN